MRRNKKRAQRWTMHRVLSVFVFITLLLSAIFLIVRIVIAPSSLTREPSVRVKSDYILMLVQCLLGIVAMLLPGIFSRRAQVHIPSGMLTLYALFLYCAIYLGEVKSFYYNVSSWDTVLHCFSGAMLGALGFSFVTLLNNSECVPVNLSPIFVALFAFCFAVTLGVFWEIYEYTFDGFLGLNMQKFALEDGTLLQGHAALYDTMKDLIVDAAGALVISFIGYLSLRYKKGWIEKFQIRRKHHSATDN